MCASRSSSTSTVLMTSKSCRAQDGQEMMLTPRWRRPSDFSMSKPTLISSTGSAESETRIVSPMPAHSSEPMPIDDLTVPVRRRAGLGDAEMQRVVAGLGQLLIGGDGEEDVGRLHADLELVEVVVLAGCGRGRARSRPSPPGRARRTSPAGRVSSEPALTPMRIEQPWSLAAWITSRTRSARADVAGIDAQAGGARLGRLDGALVVEMDVGDDRHLDACGRSPCSAARRVLVRAGDAHDVGAGLFQRADLRRWSPRRRRSACWSSTGR